MKVRFYCDVPVHNFYDPGAIPNLYAGTRLSDDPPGAGYKRVGFDVDMPAGVLTRHEPEEISVVSNIEVVP